MFVEVEKFTPISLRPLLFRHLLQCIIPDIDFFSHVLTVDLLCDVGFPLELVPHLSLLPILRPLVVRLSHTNQFRLEWRAQESLYLFRE